MKAYKTITIISVVLLSIIITIASFMGIYKLNEYKIKNVVPEYLLGMELNNNRMVQLKVDNSVESTTVYDADGNVVEQEEGVEYTQENGYTTVENKANGEDKLTKENYKLSKEILIKRLQAMGLEQYLIKQDETNGNIQIHIPENDSTDDIVKNLSQVGKFELKDEDTSEVLMDNSYIKSTTVVYGSTDATATTTTVYLQIQFNKEGTKKLEEISKIYVETISQVENEEGEMEEKKDTKNVSIVFDGETYRSTYFGQTMNEGILNIAIGASSDTSELQEYMKTASQFAINLNSGLMPIKYITTQIIIQPYVNSNCINIIAYILIGILIVSYIYIIIRFKMKGLILSIIQIGYIGLLLLAIRYTNVVITLEGIIGIILSIALNYIFNFAILKNIQKDKVDMKSSIKDTILKFLINLIPLYIVAIVFTFIKIVNISSLGMTMFWGIIIMYIYILITKIVLEAIAEKK